MDEELIKSIATDFARDTNKDEILDMNVWYDNWWENNKLNYVRVKDFVKKTILEHSNEIIFNRGEEKNRKYGPFSESMGKASKVASIMTNKDITTEDMFKCLIALKISRLSYNHDYDTVLDCIGYLAGLDNFIKEKTI